MCGICGLVSRRDESVDPDVLARMSATLVHRGPDDEGMEIRGRVGLGFRRLSILDLSPAGHQPMGTLDGATWVVFNGEIYNYVELRDELREQGYRFRGTSDTEVLLTLYQACGTDMFGKINGMFALAIYDAENHAMLLGRDRIGKKPLYYWHDGQRLAFASELRALRVVPGFPTGIDPVALGLYLRLGFVPNSFCIHPGTSKLPPSSYLLWSLDKPLPAPVVYWRPPLSDGRTDRPQDDIVDEIQEVLWDATRIRLRSDVPIGVFLSSGVDSGLVAAAAAAHVSLPVRSLTIGFPGWEGDEWPEASAVARHLGLDPRHYPVAEDGAASLQSVMGHFDEPFADSSALPTMLICRAARRDLTVALSGDGGDELFGGYENHLRAWRFRSMDSVPPPVRRSIGRVLAAVSPADSRLRRFAKRLPHRLGMFGLGAKLYPFEDWIGTCVREPYRLNDSLACELIRLNHRSLAEEDTAEHPQQVDLRLYLLDDVLVKVDRMSMWHSLEVRSPFLDYRVVELALRLPLGLHVAGGRSKHLTRLLAGRVLPRPVADAPKRGFAIPLRDWLLRGPMTETFRRMTRELEEEGWVLLPNAADRVWRAAESNPALTAALFRLLALSMWLRATSQGIPQQDGRGRTHSEWYASHGTPVSGHRHV